MTLTNPDLDLEEIPDPNKVLAPFFRALAVVFSGILFFCISWLSAGHLIASLVGGGSVSILTFGALYFPPELRRKGLRTAAFTLFVILPVGLTCYVTIQLAMGIMGFLLAYPCLGAGAMFVVLLLILAIAAASLADPEDTSAKELSSPVCSEEQVRDLRSSRYTIKQRRLAWENCKRACYRCTKSLADWRGENMRIQEVRSEDKSIKLVGICISCDKNSTVIQNDSGDASMENTQRKKWSLKTRERIWTRYMKRCYYCHKKLVSFRGEHMHLDHRKPFSRGGADDEDNLVPACPTCNLEKSDAEYPELE